MTSVTLVSLPDTVLELIVSQCDFQERLHHLPLVCRRLADFCRGPLAWHNVEVVMAAQPLAVHDNKQAEKLKLSSKKLLRWLQDRGVGCRQLTLSGLHDYTEVQLHDLGRDSSGFEAVAAVLQCCPNLRRLSLHNSELDTHAVRLLSSPPLATSLESLRLQFTPEWAHYNRRRFAPPAMLGEDLSALGQCRALRELVLDGGELRKQYLLDALPGFVSKLTGLQVLSMAGIRADVCLRPTLTALRRLERLSLTKLTLVASGDENSDDDDDDDGGDDGGGVREGAGFGLGTLARLPRLREVSLCRTYVGCGALHSALAGATQLSRLDLRCLRAKEDSGDDEEGAGTGDGFDAIETMLQVLSSLVHLKELRLRHMELDCVPEEVLKLTKLTLLDLSYNQITSLPDGITALRDLELLNIDRQERGHYDGMGLLSIPRSIADMPRLRIGMDAVWQHLKSSYEQGGYCLTDAVPTGPIHLAIELVPAQVEGNLLITNVELMLTPTVQRGGRLSWGWMVKGGDLAHVDELLGVIQGLNDFFSRSIP